VKAIVAAALVAAAALMAGCSTSAPPELDRFTDLCHQHGGLVSKQIQGWNTVYGCPGAKPPIPNISR
jgi:hypothetical protein